MVLSEIHRISHSRSVLSFSLCLEIPSSHIWCSEKFQCSTSSTLAHFEHKPTATKRRSLILKSLTFDNITSPDSVRAASLESTNRTELFISSSSSSRQSGLLAPTAKTIKLMNLGRIFKANSKHVLSKRHVWTNNGHYCGNVIYSLTLSLVTCSLVLKKQQHKTGCTWTTGEGWDFSQPGLSCNAEVYMACFCKVLMP